MTHPDSFTDTAATSDVHPTEPQKIERGLLGLPEYQPGANTLEDVIYQPWIDYQLVPGKPHSEPTFRPRFDYRKDESEYTGYNPYTHWKNLVANTPLTKSLPQQMSDAEMERVNQMLEIQAEKFIQQLERFRQEHPFFYFVQSYVREAYILAFAIHSAEKRASGRPYIEHPEEVVMELLKIIQHAAKDPSDKIVDLTPEIMAALMHDVREDAAAKKMSHYVQMREMLWAPVLQGIRSVYDRVREMIPEVIKQPIKKMVDMPAESHETRQQMLQKELEEYISHCFPVIADTIDDLTKLSKKESISLEGYKRDMVDIIFMVQSISRDPQFITKRSDSSVLLNGFELVLKLCDRLHNIKTLEHLPAKSRARIARTTIREYVPLAILLGFNRMAQIMEDHSYQQIMPADEYAAYKGIFKEEQDKLYPIYCRKRDLLRRMLPNATVEIEDQFLGRLLSIFKMALYPKPGERLSIRLSDNKPTEAFQYFLSAQKPPLKIVVHLPDNIDSSLCREMRGLLQGAGFFESEDEIFVIDNLDGNKQEPDKELAPKNLVHMQPITDRKYKLIVKRKSGELIQIEFSNHKQDRVNNYGMIHRPLHQMLSVVINNPQIEEVFQQWPKIPDHPKEIAQVDLAQFEEMLEQLRSRSFGAIEAQMMIAR